MNNVATTFLTRASVGRRCFFRWYFQSFALLILCICFADASQADTQVRSIEKVRSVVKNFYQTYLNRPLNPAELEQIVKEFVDYYGGDGCPVACEENLALSAVHTKVMRNKRGQPEDLMLRHMYIIANYFDPKIEGALGHQLLIEFDPIRVVDMNNKRLMKQSDIVGFINIAHFLKSDGPPKQYSYTSDEIDQVAKMIDKNYGMHPGSEGLSWFAGAAAVYWAGLQREWPKLSAQERKAVRQYRMTGSLNPLPISLYRRLFGVSENDARQLYAADKKGNVHTGMNKTLSRYLDLMGRVMSSQPVIDATQDVGN